MTEPTSINKNQHTEIYIARFGEQELKVLVRYQRNQPKPHDGELIGALGPEYPFHVPEVCEVYHSTPEGMGRITLDANGIPQLLRMLGKAFPRGGSSLRYMKPPLEPLEIE